MDNVVNALKNAGERLRSKFPDEVFPAWEIKSNGLQFRFIPRTGPRGRHALARISWERIGDGMQLDEMMQAAEAEALYTYVSLHGPMYEETGW